MVKHISLRDVGDKVVYKKEVYIIDSITFSRKELPAHLLIPVKRGKRVKAVKENQMKDYLG